MLAVSCICCLVHAHTYTHFLMQHACTAYIHLMKLCTVTATAFSPVDMYWGRPVMTLVHRISKHMDKCSEAEHFSCLLWLLSALRTSQTSTVTGHFCMWLEPCTIAYTTQGYSAVLLQNWHLVLLWEHIFALLELQYTSITV